MSEHHPKNVRGILKFCKTCNRMTMHRVDYKREGGCIEHIASGMTKKQMKRKEALEKAEREPTLF